MDEQKIIEALAPMYRAEFDAYNQLSLLAKEAAHDNDVLAFAALNSRAEKRSCYLDGIKAAVAVLGISDDAFMEAVNQDQEDGGEEDV